MGSLGKKIKRCKKNIIKKILGGCSSSDLGYVKADNYVICDQLE